MSKAETVYKTLDVYVVGVSYDSHDGLFKTHSIKETQKVPISVQVMNKNPTVLLNQALLTACDLLASNGIDLALRLGMGMAVWDPKSLSEKSSYLKTKGYRPLHTTNVVRNAELIDVYEK